MSEFMFHFVVFICQCDLGRFTVDFLEICHWFVWFNSTSTLYTLSSIETIDFSRVTSIEKNLLESIYLNFSCSIDPTVIHIPKNSSPLSLFHFSFYLYHILKEPIPFEIQCRILQQDDQQIKSPLDYDCLSPSPSSSSMEHSHFAKNSNTKRDFSYTLFRSLAIHVTRQMPFDEYHPHRFSNRSVSIATVHYIECFHHAFFLLILYSI